MEKALNGFATQVCEIVTKAFYKQRNGHYTVHYKCDRGRSYRNRIGITKETRAQKTSAVLATCPLRLKAIQADL